MFVCMYVCIYDYVLKYPTGVLTKELELLFGCTGMPQN